MSAAVVRVLLVIGLAVVLLGALAWLLQDRLIYLPHGTPGDPEDAGLAKAEEVTLRTDDGLELAAWFVPGRDEAAGAVLVLPGNAGNRSVRAPLAAALAEAGPSVLLLDWRGFGGNPGAPDQEGLIADARAGAAHLVARPDVDADAIAYFGESLGGAVAVHLAHERPPRAIVLRSPFTSLADIGARHYPLLPVRRLLRDRYEVLDPVADLDAPVLVVAGEEDTIVPPSSSAEVAQAADARFVVVPGAGHNDRALLDGAHMVGAILEFLADNGFDVQPGGSPP